MTNTKELIEKLKEFQLPENEIIQLIGFVATKLEEYKLKKILEHLSTSEKVKLEQYTDEELLAKAYSLLKDKGYSLNFILREAEDEYFSTLTVKKILAEIKEDN